MPYNKLIIPENGIFVDTLINNIHITMPFAKKIAPLFISPSNAWPSPGMKNEAIVANFLSIIFSPFQLTNFRFNLSF